MISPPSLEGLDSSVVMPVRSLTPSLLQARKRYGTSSASSLSHYSTQLSSMESECCSSPRWEKDIQVRTASSLLWWFCFSWQLSSDADVHGGVGWHFPEFCRSPQKNEWLGFKFADGISLTYFLYFETWEYGGKWAFPWSHREFSRWAQSPSRAN